MHRSNSFTIIDRHQNAASSNDHSGVIGVDAQENLLTALSDVDEARSKKARTAARIFLNQLRVRAITAGIKATDIRLRYGQLEENLIEQEPGVRLFVLGRRGESAQMTHRDLGRNVERVVRSLHKPILTITRQFVEPRRVMIAFDGGMVTRRGVELVAASRLFKGLSVRLLMSGKAGGEARKQLDWAWQTLESAGFDAPALLLPGDAESIIASTVKAENIDMLIMGAYSHSPLRSLLMGSKTSDLLRSATIPTLLLR